MSAAAQPMDGQFLATDDGFHFAQIGPGWWATETAWFSFHHPQRRLGGWLYTMVRPNIGTVAGGVWIWDQTAHLPWEVPYCANYSALELPDDAKLQDIALPTGVNLTVVSPGSSYRMSMDDGERLSLALTFDGVMDPYPLTAGGSTFGNASHFDQFGRVVGEIVLHGERIEIDCIAMRDRTWSPRRPENRPKQAAYVTAAASGSHAFLAVTGATSGPSPIVHGFLRRNGHTARLVSGMRTVERDENESWVNRIVVEATDTEGRTLHAEGRSMSRMVINRHTFIDINSLVEWQLDGEIAWGEDQDMWPVHDWSAQRRSAREVAEQMPGSGA